jgi:hypothetical protein
VALGVPVLGVLPWDPKGVLGLLARGVGDRAWQRSRLAEAAERVSSFLAALTVEEARAGG